MRFTHGAFISHLQRTEARLATSYGCLKDTSSRLAQHISAQLTAITDVRNTAEKSGPLLKNEALKLLGRYLGNGPENDVAVQLRSHIQRGFPGVRNAPKTRQEVEHAISQLQLIAPDTASVLSVLLARCVERKVSHFDFDVMYEVADRYRGKVSEV